MNTIAERAQIAIATERNVPSPCTSLCRMRAADGLCEGCSRTLDEIARWAQLSDAQKRAVWQQLAQREGN